jgi:uncharacterized membrane protein YsdA (DUF1294 family)
MTPRTTLALLFLTALGVLVLLHRLPAPMLGAYVAISLACYAVYAFDKSAARKRQRRVPERMLHLLALAGGWPGALLAQQRLRHKTQKQPFVAVFWGTVALNCGALWWWLR